ncbi:hypothetical protein Trydic_g18775 [Trypoxylus dichotomus]
MVSIKCSCGCNTTSSETHKFIDCCVCKSIYLHSCTELSITEIRTIKSKKGVSWSCRNCNILSSDINDLKAAILSLRNDLAAREKSAGIDDKAFEELLAELGDRNNRKQNIIMFGVPESDTHDANTRRSRELETVQAVLKALPSGMNTDHNEVHRIGRFVPDRRRPIKVRLSSSREAHTALKHAKRLRENEQCPFAFVEAKQGFLRSALIILKRRKKKYGNKDGINLILIVQRLRKILHKVSQISSSRLVVVYQQNHAEQLKDDYKSSKEV